MSTDPQPGRAQACGSWILRHLLRGQSACRRWEGNAIKHAPARLLRLVFELLILLVLAAFRLDELRHEAANALAPPPR